MQNWTKGHTISVGLAIFSMLFGAGNLMFPLRVGMHAGSNNLFGMLGFSLTAICLPLAGLIGMILFDSDYNAFYNRLGKFPGQFLVFLSMLVIGPGLAIPRIVTLSHIMIAPFLPVAGLQEITRFSSFTFAILFLGITFLLAFRENRIVDLLGYIISPLLLLSLSVIIVKGIFTAEYAVPSTIMPFEAFKTNLIRGYSTLDLLGAIFFSSIVLHILKNKIGGTLGYNQNKLALIGLKAGTIGVSLLGIIYIGMSLLGVFHAHGLAGSHEGELFRTIAFNVMGNRGAAIIGTAVLMACLSTSMALSAVVAEYCQRTLFKDKLGYIPSLILMLFASIPLSTFGLEYVLSLTGGAITYVGYPVIIALTFCNIAYKLFGFRPVKLPVLVTFIGALVSYIW